MNSLEMEGKMKKLLIIFSALFFLNSFALSDGFKVGGSLGYYAVADSIYKETYGSGNLIYGGTVSFDVTRNIELRGEMGYFKDKGKTTLIKEEIKFSIIPTVIGMRYKFIEIKNLNPYLGIGVDFYSFKESAPIGNTSDSTTGFHIEMGSYITLGQRFYIDLFVRYVNADAKPYDEKIKLGGFRTGIGIGYSFKQLKQNNKSI